MRKYLHTRKTEVTVFRSESIYIQYGKKAWRQLHKNAANNIEQALEAAPHKAETVRPTASHHENYKN